MTAELLPRLQAALPDRFRIERELGAGGMATVYLANDLRHDRRVALKVLRPELGALIGADRFLAEIRTTANLQHPHILPLFDSGAADGLLWYAMPYVEGESLRHRLSREKQLPVDDAVRIAKEVASALDYAHRHSVIHRDIKPENILLHEGQALVADFGIALAISNAGGGRMTETGLSLGTPHYMSPEQAMGERELTARSDVYALGCVCYEMLSGEPPFTGPTAQSIVAKVMTDEPRPLTQLRRTVPANVEAAVLTALEKLPADRFGSAAEFSEALDRQSVSRYVGKSVRKSSTDLPTYRPTVLIATLLATTLLALAWGVWRTVHRLGPPVSPPRVMFTVPAELARNQTGRLIAVAPDGGKFVFVQNLGRGGSFRLALRRFDRQETLPLPGTDDAYNPFFSPDGEWIGFADGPRLRKLRLEGGTAATVADLGDDIVYLGSWAPDGTILFTTRNGYLYRVPAEGGKPTRIPLPDSGRVDAIAGYTSPIWLPGSHVILTRSPLGAGGMDRQMVVLASESGKLVATLGPGIAVQYLDAGYLAYVTPEGTLVAAPFDHRKLRLGGPPVVVAQGISYLGRALPAAVAQNGTVVYASNPWADKELVLVASNGGTTVLPVGTRAFRGPRFSPDGRRIAVDVEPGGDLLGDIYVFDRGPNTFARVTFEGSSVFPEWTADGKALLYSSGSGQSRVLMRIPVDRSAPPAAIARDAWPMYEVAQTPSGDTLLYRMNADSTGRDIYLLPHGGKPVPFAAERFEERSPTLSQDGRLVLYVSNESGQEQVYLRPLGGTSRLQVSGNGGAEPRWGPGAREAYYWNQDTLFAVPITRAPALEIGARRTVLAGHFAREAYHSNYDIAPDGKSFVFVRSIAGETASAVTVLLNWIKP